MSTRALLSKSVLRGAGYVIGLGLVVAWASLSMRLHTRPDTIQNMTPILHGEPIVFGGDTPRPHTRSTTACCFPACCGRCHTACAN
jgi:hypothetical protein